MFVLTIGSLFSGIGGLDLGLEQAGLGPVLWQCEKDEFCRAVLERHWPDVLRYHDVKNVRGGDRELLPVDLICGGFPCQDLSCAGKRAGLKGARSGLWYEFRRIVDEQRPEWVIVENVESGRAAWLPSVRADLGQLGYRTRALGVSARDVGAPHQRRRIFVVAHHDRHGVRDESERVPTRRADAVCRQGQAESRDDGAQGCVADAASVRLSWRKDAEGDCNSRVGAEQDEARRDEGSSPQSRMGRESDGLCARLDGPRWPAPPGQEQYPWEAPRTIATKSSPNRPARLRALGNAVVPECARIVGLIIRQIIERGEI